MTTSCAYGDYSCETPYGYGDYYGSEIDNTPEEEIIDDSDRWYLNTTAVKFMYWTWGAA